MKKILSLLWFSSLVTACGLMYPVSPTPIPTNPATVTPIVTPILPSVIATTILPYTSTPANVCGSYEIGHRIFLDEVPAFTVRQGPGCEYEAAQSRLFKSDPLIFYYVLGKQGDWLLVDMCNSVQGWVFAPAIDDISLDVNPDDLSILEPPATQVGIPSPLPSNESSEAIEQAKKTLVSFYDFLHGRRYEEAAKLFGGGYGGILMWNPDVDPQDYPTLLTRACEWDEYQCFLRVNRVVNGRQISSMEYQIIVEFINEDGSLYQRRDPQDESLLISKFPLQIVRDCDGKYLVVNWPFYIQHTGP